MLAKGIAIVIAALLLLTACGANTTNVKPDAQDLNGIGKKPVPLQPTKPESILGDLGHVMMPIDPLPSPPPQPAKPESILGDLGHVNPGAQPDGGCAIPAVSDEVTP